VGGAEPVPPHAFTITGDRLLGASFRREAGRFGLVERHAVALPAGALPAGALGGPVADGGLLAAAVGELVGRFAKPPGRASLVLPDAWARGLVVELGALPERADLRTEILRFRLKKLVPFRVEELRVVAVPIASVAGQEDPVRALALYASEALCAGLESAFAASGVHLGQIVGASLARLAALAHGGRLAGLVALASVEPAGFTLVFARDGEPVVWRQKSFAEGEEGETRAPQLAAELRLTRTFLAERLGVPHVDAVVLAAPDDVRATWSAALSDGLGRPVATLAADWLPLVAETSAAGEAGLATLVGAVCREVA
jgi:hypothetical protein